MSGFCDIGDLCLRTEFKNLKKKDQKNIESVLKNCHPDYKMSLMKCYREFDFNNPADIHIVEP